MLQKQHNNKHSGTHPTSKKLLILILFVACICIYASKANIREININIPFLTKANPDVQEQLVTEEQISTHKVKPEEPRYFSMPSLNITKSRIIGVGFEKGTKKIDTTPNIHDVAWFNLSGLQNQTEKVIVLNGHNGGPNIDGIFKNLPNVEKGEIFFKAGAGGEVQAGRLQGAAGEFHAGDLLGLAGAGRLLPGLLEFTPGHTLVAQQIGLGVAAGVGHSLDRKSVV